MKVIIKRPFRHDELGAFLERGKRVEIPDEHAEELLKLGYVEAVSVRQKSKVEEE